MRIRVLPRADLITHLFFLSRLNKLTTGIGLYFRLSYHGYVNSFVDMITRELNSSILHGYNDMERWKNKIRHVRGFLGVRRRILVIDKKEKDCRLKLIDALDIKVKVAPLNV